MSSVFWQIVILLLVVAIGLLAFFQIGTMRQVGALLVQLRPGRIGEVEGGPDIDTVVVVPGLPEGRPAVVLFVSPSCSLCELLKPSIPVVREHFPEIQMLSVVIGSDAAKRLEYARSIPGARADIPELAELWDVQGTPFVVGIDETHRVRSRGVVNTLDQLENLAEAILLPREPMLAEQVDQQPSSNGRVTVEAAGPAATH